MGAAPLAPKPPPEPPRTIADPEFHGKGEGIFMKSLNCGCMVALGVVGLIIAVFVLASLNS